MMKAESLPEARKTERCTPGRARGEQGKLSRWADLPGVELLTADYKRHAYAPHWHDTYTIALVARGCERVRLGGAERRVTPGDVVCLNPGEIHDGEAYDESVGWAFRAFYLEPEVLRHTLGEGGSGFVFQERLLANWPGWQMLLKLHEGLSRPDSLLERSSLLFAGISRLRQAAGPDRERRVATPALERAREYVHARWSDSISLGELAQVAGLSRFHLLRSFRASFGLPPHAYQTQLRILRAKEMLFRGRAPGEVALEVGFFDQAHFSNTLRRYAGVTPGRVCEHSTRQSSL